MNDLNESHACIHAPAEHTNIETLPLFDVKVKL